MVLGTVSTNDADPCILGTHGGSHDCALGQTASKFRVRATKRDRCLMRLCPCRMTDIAHDSLPVPVPAPLGPLRFYPDLLPTVGTLVVAIIGAIHDTSVDCTLPAYGDVAVLLPTSEIPVRKHRRVTDYVRQGQLLVVDVVRNIHGQVDVSMKRISESEGSAVLAKYHRDAKAHLIVRTAADLDEGAAIQLYTTVVWPLMEQHTGDGSDTHTTSDILSVFEEVRSQSSVVGEDVALPRCPLNTGIASVPICSVHRPHSLPAALVRAIHTKLPERTYTAVKEVRLQYAIGGGSVADLNATLRRLAALEGIQVFVTAPPLYRIVATDRSPASAAARLATAV